MCGDTIMSKHMDPLLEDLIDKVPEYKEFKNVDELDAFLKNIAEEHKDLVKLEVSGYTRNGDEIYSLIIDGEGPAVLLIGAPHPNEPIGTLTIEYLVRRLTEDEEFRKAFSFKWVIVPVADKDGLRLNEGWLKGPFNIINYAKNYYRPAGNVQVEWSFPITYKRYSYTNPTPETRALMRLIYKYRPIFIYSLHNAGFGGVYYYISQDIPLLYPIFRLFPKTLGIPLSLGEPEVPWAKCLGRAVYKMVTLKDNYDFLESLGKDPLEVLDHGGSTYDYASERVNNVLELVTEVPYFYDPRIEDLSPHEMLRRDAVLEGIKHRENTLKFITEIYARIKEYVNVERHRIAESIEYMIKKTPKTIEAEKMWALKDKSLERKAYTSEVFDSLLITRFYSLLSLGMLYRLVKEVAKEKRYVELAETVENKFYEEGAYLERELKYTVINLKDLVKTQLNAGIYALLYLREQQT
ncbi:MAG: hypothetical protein B7O98_09430 [Zestosphaera tikiterensis]|uniref:Peptidase M14 domain-containing protein n=1 Tax=Zestosphaera tikiterensis TaxID=1973259 RepID=A0A2R7Y3G5_9CREN|nr:MAG: hypothetical protein B7O98_09430 [Zestosphaera tikiterensis]